MSILKTADECLIFYSILINTKNIKLLDVEELVLDRLGPSICFQHSFCPMKNYYSKEMGGNPEDLFRLVFVSLGCFERKNLVLEKLWADDYEKKLSSNHGYRVINLDVGSISLENVILSTGKNYAHRIYLDSGVFAELTYQFKDSKYFPLQWTYPDYCHSDFTEFFNFCRSLLFRKLVK